MANYIPKIQYRNITTSATVTAGSATLTNILAPSTLLAGMIISCPNISAGTTLTYVDTELGTATMSQAASSGGTGVSMEFYFEIPFTYPPEGMPSEDSQATRTVTPSLSGVVQTVLNFIEVKFSGTFKLITQSTVDLLQTFYENHAAIGSTFRYYESSDVATYVEYTYDQDGFTPERQTWTGTAFTYSVDMSFRRVL